MAADTPRKPGGAAAATIAGWIRAPQRGSLRPRHVPPEEGSAQEVARASCGPSERGSPTHFQDPGRVRKTPPHHLEWPRGGGPRHFLRTPVARPSAAPPSPAASPWPTRSSGWAPTRTAGPTPGAWDTTWARRSAAWWAGSPSSIAGTGRRSRSWASPSGRGRAGRRGDRGYCGHCGFFAGRTHARGGRDRRSAANHQNPRNSPGAARRPPLPHHPRHRLHVSVPPLARAVALEKQASGDLPLRQPFSRPSNLHAGGRRCSGPAALPRSGSTPEAAPRARSQCVRAAGSRARCPWSPRL